MSVPNVLILDCTQYFPGARDHSPLMVRPLNEIYYSFEMVVSTNQALNLNACPDFLYTIMFIYCIFVNMCLLIARVLL